NDAFERLLYFIAALAVDEAQDNRLSARAMEYDFTRLVREVRPGSVEVEIIGASEACQHLHVIGAGRVGLGPRNDRALLDRQRVIRDHQILVEDQLLAKAVARGTSSL